MTHPEQIVEILRTRIVGLDVPAGMPLREESLSRELAASRRTVRDALIQLERAGLVDRERNRGARVRSFTAADVADLYQARRAWETFGAAHTGSAPPEATAAVETAFDVLAEVAHTAPDSVRHAELDMAFHAAVAALAQSPRLDRAFGDLREEMTFAIRILQRDEAVSPMRIEADLDEHRAIADAIRDGDAGAAVAAVEAHIRANRARLVRLAQGAAVPVAR